MYQAIINNYTDNITTLWYNKFKHYFSKKYKNNEDFFVNINNKFIELTKT